MTKSVSPVLHLCLNYRLVIWESLKETTCFRALPLVCQFRYGKTRIVFVKLNNMQMKSQNTMKMFGCKTICIYPTYTTRRFSCNGLLFSMSPPFCLMMISSCCLEFLKEVNCLFSTISWNKTTGLLPTIASCKQKETWHWLSQN